jgi:hypothetical protein
MCLVRRARAFVVVMAVLVSACAAGPDPIGIEPTSTTEEPPLSTTASEPSVESAVGSASAGFADVEQALASARERWRAAAIDAYRYRLTIECECPEAGTSWVRLFPESVRLDDGDHLTVDRLFDRIAAVIDHEPARLEVAFSSEDGRPVSYTAQGGAQPEAMRADEFGQITGEPSEFDGTWTFVLGTVASEEFRNPATTRLWVRIEAMHGIQTLQYPTDCNNTNGPVDIHDGWFGVGHRVSTSMGCVTSRQVMLFETAFARADQIRLEGGELVLAGPGVELRFGPPPSVEFLGELPLTAAGETLTFEVPAGRDRSGTYLLGGRLDDPFGFVYYQLTAAVAGEGEPTWEGYRGQPDSPGVMVSGDGPDTILVPDVGEGDFALCSPYWEPDPFCFTLRVRPPSQPWIVTAGLEGVFLLDADGTSGWLWEGPTEVAYHLDGQVLIEPVGGDAALTLLAGDGSETHIPVEAGERLIEAALVGGQPLAVLSSGRGTVVLDVDTGERTQVGPQATAATMAGGFLALRLTPETVIGVDLDGELMWERDVDARTMILAAGDVFRFDVLDTLQSDAGPEPYFQYVVTELVEVTTGETMGAYDREVAIPDSGDNIAEPCIRPDLWEAGVLVCAQPDGRVVTLEVDGGLSRTVATDVTAATFARPLR